MGNDVGPSTGRPASAREYMQTARDLTVMGSEVLLLYALAPIKIMAGALDLGSFALVRRGGQRRA